MNDATTQNLQPLIIIEDFKLERWLSEREVILRPLHFNIAEDMPCQITQCLLQILSCYVLCILNIGDTNLIVVEQTNSLHLVENRIVGLIDSVLPIDITHAEEVSVALLEQGYLVHRGVRSQYRLLIQVVGISRLSRNMISRDPQSVKAVNCLNDRVIILEKLERGSKWHIGYALRTIEEFHSVRNEG